MKIIKRIAIVIGILVVIWVIAALFVPGSMHVERSITVNAPAETVFNQVNTIRNWKNWSYWDNIDKTTMNDSFAGPESGVGAVHYWNSPNDSVRKGSLAITKSEPNSFVELALNFDNMGVNMTGWKFKDTTSGVKVTTYMDMEAPFMMRPMLLFMNMDKMLGGDFEKSLSNLKNVAESAPAAPTVRIEETMSTPMKIMSIVDSCTSANISEKLGSLYGEVSGVMAKQKLTQAGSPFAVYHKETKKPDGSMAFLLQAGLPVDKPGKTEGRVKYWEVPAVKVVKAYHYGSYESTAQTHDLMHKWIADNGKTMDGDPWEVYVTDPGIEKDQSKWLTEIYYPVK